MDPMDPLKTLQPGEFSRESKASEKAIVNLAKIDGMFEQQFEEHQDKEADEAVEAGASRRLRNRVRFQGSVLKDPRSSPPRYINYDQ